MLRTWYNELNHLFRSFLYEWCHGDHVSVIDVASYTGIKIYNKKLKLLNRIKSATYYYSSEEKQDFTKY